MNRCEIYTQAQQDRIENGNKLSGGIGNGNDGAGDDLQFMLWDRKIFVDVVYLDLDTRTVKLKCNNPIQLAKAVKLLRSLEYKPLYAST